LNYEFQGVFNFIDLVVNMQTSVISISELT